VQLQIATVVPRRRLINGTLLHDYGVAIATVFLAWLATSVLHTVSPERSLSFVFFFAAVAFSAGYRGTGPGIVATVLSALTCDYFFLPPSHSLRLTGSDLSLMVVFIVVALLINALTGRLQAGTRAADRRFQIVAQELSTLNSITAAVSSSLELPIVLANLQKQLVEQLDIPGGCILLCDDEDRFRLASAWGLPPETQEQASALRMDDLYDMIQDWDASDSTFGHTLPSMNGEADKRHLQPEAQQPIYVPLVANRTPEGVLCLYCRPDTTYIGNRARLYKTLGQQVGVLIQNARLYEQVRAGQAHLHHLSRRLVSVQEAERREIARELHDEIGQTLTGLKLSLEMSLRQTAQAPGEPLNQALTLVNELMAHVQDLSLNLRPAMLDDLGLLPTLLWHFQRYTRTTGVAVRFEHTGIERRFPAEIETTAYRVVQEALTNVARHAAVQEVTVRLWTAQHLLSVQVVDQGRGFMVYSAPTGMGAGGLAGMKERVTLLGGAWNVESTLGTGTCMLAELPLSDPEAGVSGETT
jgi:signal transduction histidine kinase